MWNTRLDLKLNSIDMVCGGMLDENCHSKDRCSVQNGRNIVGCYMLRPLAHPVACCCVLLGVVSHAHYTWFPWR